MAPVRVSRNELTLSDSDANQLIKSIRDAAIAAWTAYATRIFEETTDTDLATRRLLRALCNSVKPPSWWNRRSWSNNEKLSSAARNLLISKGEMYLYETTDLETKTKLSIREAISSRVPIVVLSNAQRSNKLFQLYASRNPEYKAIVANSKREIDLLMSCNNKWRRLASEEDLWSAIHIEEDDLSPINNVIPAEIAVVGSAYFPEREVIAVVLPTRRAPADRVEGITRREARNVRPRVLLNRDHQVLIALDKALAERPNDVGEVRHIFEIIITGIVEEKAKGRRDRRAQILVERIMRYLDLPESTRAKIVI